MKAIYKILAIALCMIMSFTIFTGCDFSGSINLGGGNQNNSSSNDDNTPNREVTKEQFTQAFLTSSAEIPLQISGSVDIIDGLDTMDMNFSFVRKNNLLKIEIEGLPDGLYDGTYYVEKTSSSEFWVYANVNGTWFKEKNNSDGSEMFSLVSAYYPKNFVEQTGLEYLLVFEEFEYNQSAGYYSRVAEDSGLLAEVRLYFEDAKIVKIEMLESVDGFNANSTASLTYGYEDIAVVLPNVTDDDNTGDDNIDNGNDDNVDNGGNTDAEQPNDQPTDQPDDGNDDNAGNEDNSGDNGTTDDNTGDSSEEDNDNVVEGADAIIQGGVTYALLENGTYAVTEFDASVTEVTVLAQVNGAPVTEIASGAFRAKKKITKVTLPESVVKIGDSSFKDCIKLAEINLDKVEIIGANAFENAFADKRAVINLSSLEEIGLKAFLNCPKLGVVDFGNAPVVEIPKQCFASCSLLYTVTLSQYTTYLEESCFDSCNLLTNINLDKVEYIRLNAFRGCASITEAQLDSIIEIGDYAFLNCNMLARVVIGENAGRIYLGAFRTLYALKYFEIKTATTKDWRYYFVNAYEDRPDKLHADGWTGEDKLADPAACAEWITIRKNNYVWICTSEWSDAMGIVPGKTYPKGQIWS